MGVAGELEEDAALFGNGKAVGNVGEEDAGAGGIQVGVGQNGTEAFGVGGIVIGDAENLEAVEINGFVMEDADTGFADGVEILGGV